MSALLLPVCGVRKSLVDGKSRQEVVAIAEWAVEGELAILESYCRMNDITANWVAHRKGEPAPAGMSALIRGSSFRPGEEEMWIPSRLPFSVAPVSEAEAEEVLHVFKKIVRIIPVVDEPNKDRWRRAQRALYRLIVLLGGSAENFAFPVISVSRTGGAIYVHDFFKMLWPTPLLAYPLPGGMLLRVADHVYHERNRRPQWDVYCGTGRLPAGMVTPEQATQAILEKHGFRED